MLTVKLKRKKMKIKKIYKNKVPRISEKFGFCEKRGLCDNRNPKLTIVRVYCDLESNLFLSA